jgi:hypothetical protein
LKPQYVSCLGIQPIRVGINDFDVAFIPLLALELSQIRSTGSLKEGRAVGVELVDVP